jgi:hypothetical protein
MVREAKGGDAKVRDTTVRDDMFAHAVISDAMDAMDTNGMDAHTLVSETGML